MYEKAVKNNKNISKQELLSKMNQFHDRDTKKYWELFNSLKNVKTNSSKSSAISADEWVQYYKKLYRVEPDMDKDIIDCLVHREFENECQIHLDSEISVKEMYDKIRKLKNNKSPGPDGIINEILKCGKFYLVPLIRKLFNLIMESGCFPSVWKKGFIINIHKSGTIVDPNNYRGITLSSSLGKLLSLILNERLVRYLNSKNIYSEYQFGFRSDHRTTDSIFIINEIMGKYRNSKKRLYLGFIDFRKAFDKIWRAALLLKLLKIGIGGQFYKVIKNMYTQNLSAVKLDGVHAEYFDCPLGVRQGDGLSPTLFNVFINDVQDLFNCEDCHPAKYHGITIGCLLYADDLVIISESSSGLQASLDKLSEYCRQWKLEINVCKSKVMIASKRKVCSENNLLVNGEELEYVERYKYLGLYMTYNGSMQYAQAHLAERAVKAWHSVKNGLYNQKVWPVNIYVKSFDTVIKPITLYGCEIWGLNIINYKDTNRFHMPGFDVSMPGEKLHVRVCKQILRVSKKATNIACLAELGRLPLYADMIQSLVNYFVRLESLTKPSLIQKVYQQSKASHGRLTKVMEYLKDQVSYPRHNAYTVDRSFVLGMKAHIQSYFEKIFFYFMHSDKNKKLCTYRYIKEQYCCEQYLEHLTDPSIRKNVTSLRISSHRLNVERGRYKNIDRHKRVCKLCMSGMVEDEFHFIMQCKAYDDIRRRYLKEIIDGQFLMFSEWDIFVQILTSANRNVIVQYANYIYEAFKKRNYIIMNTM